MDIRFRKLHLILSNYKKYTCSSSNILGDGKLLVPACIASVPAESIRGVEVNTAKTKFKNKAHKNNTLTHFNTLTIV